MNYSWCITGIQTEINKRVNELCLIKHAILWQGGIPKQRFRQRLYKMGKIRLYANGYRLFCEIAKLKAIKSDLEYKSLNVYLH